MSENKENNLFYCYSNRLALFLRSFRFRYINSSVNKNSNTKYWVFEKSDKLDEAIQLYNEVKHKIEINN